MAHKGIAHLSSSILEDEAKSALSGNQIFDVATTAAGTHEWVYIKKAFSANTQLITATADYVSTGTAIHDNDVVKYRLSLCSQCENFTKTRQCTKCLCFMDLKARLGGSVCPESKW